MKAALLLAAACSLCTAFTVPARLSRPHAVRCSTRCSTLRLQQAEPEAEIAAVSEEKSVTGAAPEKKVTSRLGGVSDPDSNVLSRTQLPVVLAVFFTFVFLAAGGQVGGMLESQGLVGNGPLLDVLSNVK